jgi:hypothetical protein
MTSIGNHEMGGPDTFYNGSDSGGECGIAYASRFIMPAPADGGMGVRGGAQTAGGRVRVRASGAASPWYGMVHGMVHIIMMSTEHDFNKGTEQYTFLQQELERVDRSITPWLIFSGHRVRVCVCVCVCGRAREASSLFTHTHTHTHTLTLSHTQPMYEDSSDPSQDQGMNQLRGALEDLLYEHKVDLALWGHNHSYQRTCQVYNLECVGPRGDTHTNTTSSSSSSSTTTTSSYAAPTHAVIGMAGYWLTEELPSQSAPYIEAAYNKYYGYMRINVNATHMHCQFVEDRYGNIQDEFTLNVQQ